MNTLQAGDRLPGISTVCKDGGPFEWADWHQGREVLLAVLKIECPVCSLIAPFLGRVHEDLKSPQFQVLMLLENISDEAQQFSQDYDLTCETILDLAPYSISRDLNLVAVPTLFLIDSENIILQSISEFDKKGLTAMADLIAKNTGHGGYTLFKSTDQVPEFRPG